MDDSKFFLTDSEILSDDSDIQKRQNLIDKDALLILIDSSHKMKKIENSVKSPLIEILEIVMEILKGKIISKPTDLISIILFNSNKTINEFEFKGIELFSGELDMPSIELVRKIRNFHKILKTLSQKEGKTKSNFYELLSICQKMFNKKKNYISKRIFIFTNDDQPFDINDRVAKQTTLKINDLIEEKIKIELFPILNKNHQFDSTIIFDKIFKNNLNIKKRPEFSNLSFLIQNIRKKEFNKRAVSKTIFRLFDDFCISVDIFLITKRTEKQKSFFIDSETNEIANPISKYFDSKNKNLCEKENLEKYYDFAGFQISASKEILKNLSSFGFSELKLIGFLPFDEIKYEENIRPPFFIRPSDRIIGSKNFFTYLLLALSKQKNAILCKLYLKKLKVPRLVYLLPQEEKMDKIEKVMIPAGFVVIFIPFAEERRKFNIDCNFKVDNILIDAARNFINSLTIKNFSPRQFNDPLLNKFYTLLEAHALELPFDEKSLLDKTLPNYSLIDSSLESTKFVEIFENLTQNIKFSKFEENFANRAKRRKVEISDIDFAVLAKNKLLQKCSVMQLRKFCEENGLSKKGKKAELLERVADFVLKK